MGQKIAISVECLAGGRNVSAAGTRTASGLRSGEPGGRGGAEARLGSIAGNGPGRTGRNMGAAGSDEDGEVRVSGPGPESGGPRGGAPGQAAAFRPRALGAYW